MFGVDGYLIIAALATQIVLGLYGAGIRRPFGSLKTIQNLSPRMRRSDGIVFFFDTIFVLFILGMWTVMLWRGPTLALISLGLIFWVIGDILAQRISIIPSFYISAVLAVASIISVV